MANEATATQTHPGPEDLDPANAEPIDADATTQTDEQKRSKLRVIAGGAAHVPGQVITVTSAAIQMAWAKARELIEKLNLREKLNSIMPFVVGAFIFMGGWAISVLAFGSLLSSWALVGTGMLSGFLVVQWLIKHSVLVTDEVKAQLKAQAVAAA